MRKYFYPLFVVLFIVIAALALKWQGALWSLIVIVPLFIMGIYDMHQTKHAIRRNFPIAGRLRYLFESIRPEIQQYFVESDTSGQPFNRLTRSLVYQRAKKVRDTVPFGTQLDVYKADYHWINHSISALDPHSLDHNPRVMIGSSQCAQPYPSSLFNISAMSFGSLSKNAILALNGGAKIGEFFHNTGEGGLSPHHLAPGGDICWNIGTGYFSCRNSDGTFNFEEYKKRATLPNVKMIEVKFSQGAKPGHGGILPKEKVTDEIAEIRLVEKGNDIISPPYHSAFTTPREFVHFVKKLRDGNGGKPVGFKICIGNRSEFIAICKAMVEEQIYVDFIAVDGGEGGTGAAPLEFTNYVGMPLKDAIVFVHDTLKGFGIKDQIKIIASGKVTSGFHIMECLSHGADLCNSARGMMFALGCIQALRCNDNECPTGVATQKRHLVKGLVVADKKVRVANYHNETVKSAVELMGAAGIDHPDKVERFVMFRRVSRTEVETLEQTYPEVEPGCMLQESSVPEKYLASWQGASADRFKSYRLVEKKTTQPLETV